MITLDEFRNQFINEDVNVEANTSSRHECDVFIENAVDILKNDYSLVTEMNLCYFDFTKGNRAFKSMHIDAAYLDVESNTLNLLYADYNQDEIANLTNDFLNTKSQLMVNFFENCLKGFFDDGEKSSEAYQLSQEIKNNADLIYKVHLFIVSTNRLSKAVKKLRLDECKFNDKTFFIELDVLDIEKIYRSKLPGFKKDEIEIECEKYGISGIPYIKANLDTDQYESYLAIVPGKFLSDIYKDYDSSLLESNVRSFLKFNGSVNKGIKETILKEKDRFFTYNNGISTTAESITVDESKGLITSFKNLQIINGGQTTATLAASSLKYNADLSGIYVQMKLTILQKEDPDLIRYIATYANSQNKVKTADLNSSHPFYVAMEKYSRTIYAPLASGSIIQELWFFERARGQYDQPMMQMTKKEASDYKLIRPKNKKFTLTDLAKYSNAADMLPHYVSWGGEVNASHFHGAMVKQWEKDSSVYNELFYKELIGKKILFTYIEGIISNQHWYQERKAYRPQLVAYTFAKLVLSAKNADKIIDYKRIWDKQGVSTIFDEDIAAIGKLVFDCIYDDSRSTANIETYCKKEECWNIVKAKPYTLSESSYDMLITPGDHKIDVIAAKKEKRSRDNLVNEISIFNKGSKYWKSIIERGKKQQVLNALEEKTLNIAVKYCDLVYTELSKNQVKDISAIVEKMKENGIE